MPGRIFLVRGAKTPQKGQCIFFLPEELMSFKKVLPVDSK